MADRRPYPRSPRPQPCAEALAIIEQMEIYQRAVGYEPAAALEMAVVHILGLELPTIRAIISPHVNLSPLGQALQERALRTHHVVPWAKWERTATWWLERDPAGIYGAHWRVLLAWRTAVRRLPEPRQLLLIFQANHKGPML